MSAGVKLDAGKAPLDLLPSSFISWVMRLTPAAVVDPAALLFTTASGLEYPFNAEVVSSVAQHLAFAMGGRAALLLGTARALGIGAKKYPLHNWKKGFPPGQVKAALLRHLLAKAEGASTHQATFLDVDGLDHYDNAAANLLFLWWICKMEIDLPETRWPSSPHNTEILTKGIDPASPPGPAEIVRVLIP